MTPEQEKALERYRRALAEWKELQRTEGPTISVWHKRLRGPAYAPLRTAPRPDNVIRFPVERTRGFREL